VSVSVSLCLISSHLSVRFRLFFTLYGLSLSKREFFGVGALELCGSFFGRCARRCRVVCFEFPAGEIYQCENGHLLCQTCHKKVIEGPKLVCPSCRVRLSRERPHRNRFAEVVLARLMVSCSNEGCQARVEFANVQKHEKESCGFRKVICKYQPLGCDWVGIFNKKRPHEKNCPIRVKSVKHILKRVRQRSVDQANEFKKVEDSLSAQRQVCKLLTSRCKDIHIRDVVLEKDVICDEFCSKTFTAVGLAWEAILCKPTDPKFGLFLRVVSSVKRKTSIQVFILPGPNFEMDLPPSIYKVVIKKKSTQSQLLELPITKEQGAPLYERDMNLRIGFIDISRGRVRQGFTTVAPVGETTSSDDSDDGEEFSDLETYDDNLSDAESSELEYTDEDG